MSFTLRPLNDIMGAEIIGVDLSRAIDPATIKAISAVFLDHLVVCFRGQSLDAAALATAARNFGKPKPHLYRQYWVDGLPEVSVVSSENRDTHGTGKRYFRATHFHTDESYKAEPAKATLLHAVVVPKKGGETRFVNMYRAYDTLPEELKHAIEGRSAIHRFASARKDIVLPTLTEEEKADTPDVVHPVVRTHDETERKALYVNAARTVAIVDMEPEESARTLQAIFDHSTRTVFQYHHHWRVGDLLMWDNRCTMHAATPNYDPEKERRYLLRTLLAGSHPR